MSEKKIIGIICFVVILISLGFIWFSMTHTTINIRGGLVPRKIIWIDGNYKYKDYEIVQTPNGEQVIINFERKNK